MKGERQKKEHFEHILILNENVYIKGELMKFIGIYIYNVYA